MKYFLLFRAGEVPCVHGECVLRGEGGTLQIFPAPQGGQQRRKGSKCTKVTIQWIQNSMDVKQSGYLEANNIRVVSYPQRTVDMP